MATEGHRRARRFSSSIPQRWRTIAAALVGAALLGAVSVEIWQLDSRASGFSHGWPDAIECKTRLPDQVGASPLIFYFNGIRGARRGLGDVAGYFLAGSYNKDGKYSPHEIWFTNNDSRKMVLAGDLKKAGNLDETESYYVEWFPNVDCGGKDMAEIIRHGNAFSFARAYR